MNCKAGQIKCFNTLQNDFWKEVITTYLDNKSRVTLEEVNCNNFLNQMLFNNNLITYKKKVLFFPKWQKRGLEQVKDVINFRGKRMLSLEEIQTSTGQNIANNLSVQRFDERDSKTLA